MFLYIYITKVISIKLINSIFKNIFQYGVSDEEDVRMR